MSPWSLVRMAISARGANSAARVTAPPMARMIFRPVGAISSMDFPSPLPQYWAAMMPTPMLKPVTSRLRKNCTFPAWDTEAISCCPSRPSITASVTLTSASIKF